jgi:hypothetical protein
VQKLKSQITTATFFSTTFTMLTLLFQGFVFLVLLSLVPKFFLLGWVLWNRSKSSKLRRQQTKGNKKVIAFFHPYCSAGGGGERVLWKIIEVLGGLYEQGFALEVIIYTVDPPSTSYTDGESGSGVCLSTFDSLSHVSTNSLLANRLSFSTSYRFD